MPIWSASFATRSYVLSSLSWSYLYDRYGSIWSFFKDASSWYSRKRGKSKKLLACTTLASRRPYSELSSIQWLFEHLFHFLFQVGQLWISKIDKLQSVNSCRNSHPVPSWHRLNASGRAPRLQCFLRSWQFQFPKGCGRIMADAAELHPFKVNRIVDFK